jgi:hypothetical protein
MKSKSHSNTKVRVGERLWTPPYTYGSHEDGSLREVGAVYFGIPDGDWEPVHGRFAASCNKCDRMFVAAGDFTAEHCVTVHIKGTEGQPACQGRGSTDVYSRLLTNAQTAHGLARELVLGRRHRVMVLGPEAIQ